MNPLPSDISADFAPTAQTLWAIWGKAPDYQVESGWSEPVYQLWTLSAPGAAGLAEIKASMPTQFLAAVPMEQLANAKALLDASESSKIGALWPSWLPKIKSASFFLRKAGEQGLDMGFGQAGDANGNEVVLEGRIRDFLDLYSEGERILREKDYTAILDDRRPVEPGHPEDWLEYMKSPEHYGMVREFAESPHD